MTNTRSFRNARLPDNRGLADLAARGFGRREIAERYGVSGQAVRDRYAALGLDVPLDVYRPEPSGLRKTVKMTPAGAVSLPALTFLEKRA